MEELLLEGYRYKFTLNTRTFIADFHHIDYVTKTLFVSRYADENGCVPGIRSMPFTWIKQVDLLDDNIMNEIETIDLSKIPITNNKKKSKGPTIINNFMT
jgi:hypothetical protein